ncbi:MAG: tRNA (N6-isopentenyl adenosine(37)-C2)-methylthiotransferase MiaB [Candidatus Gastranaerophilales bacterium]|nr:tRNA (N6-isopentenyl adenosine(37)-C2)-methylthiotransferase MiaB [Candidatus Gastranaerophilales bacterium]
MDAAVYIETLGCQMNKSDSERIYGMLENLGYKKAQSDEEASLLIVNTCNIRQLSADKAYSLLGRWIKLREQNPEIKIAMCGCVAQQDKEEVRRRLPGVDLVFGTLNIPQLPDLIKKIEGGEKVVCISKDPVSRDKESKNIVRTEGFNAWVPIIDGCDYFCTYCVVPYVRGRQRSRNMQAIIEEVQNVAKQGFKEVTLLGQTVDSYGRDLEDKNVTLANLLRELVKIEDILRIRFVTSYPTDISDELIEVVREYPKICEYFHIPMQSGSNEVLKNMRRKYTREQYIEIVKKIRSKVENVTVTSDFIVGFPGETRQQFEETVSIIEELELDYSNTAAYSPRKQTPAATWRDKFIDKAVKKERLAVLNKKVQEYSYLSNQKYVGKTLEVLVEEFNPKNAQNILTGRTRNNKVVHFEGTPDLIGTLTDVTIDEALLWCLKGCIKN